MNAQLTQNLSGEVAIVTGGATGLGLGITESLVEAGAKVIVLGRTPAEEVASVLAPFGDRVGYHVYDITDTDNAPHMVERILQEEKNISILVNNAGNHCKKPIEEMSVQEFSSVLDTHLVGAFALTKAVIPHMKEKQHGSIVFQASMTSYIGQPNVSGYATAKAGYLGLVHTLASECGPYKVRVNAIAPGWIDTPMFQKATQHDPERLKKIMGRIPLQEVGTARDIGMATAFLCSPAARYITGACIPVDGGALIGF